MEAFLELHRKGHTIVLITHEPEIAAFAERVIFIRDGLIESDIKTDTNLRTNSESTNKKN